jgi:hypothetical protein
MSQIHVRFSRWQTKAGARRYEPQQPPNSTQATNPRRVHCADDASNFRKFVRVA